MLAAGISETCSAQSGVLGQPSLAPSTYAFGADEPGQVVAQRAHQHEFGPAVARAPQMVAGRMPAGAAGAHHRVLDRDAAEAEEQLGMPLEHGPGGRPVEELAHRADDARHDDGLSAVAA